MECYIKMLSSVSFQRSSQDNYFSNKKYIIIFLDINTNFHFGNNNHCMHDNSKLCVNSIDFAHQSIMIMYTSSNKAY